MFNSKPMIDTIAPLVTILFIFLTTGCFRIYKWQCLSALNNVISLMNDNTKNNNIIKNHYQGNCVEGFRDSKGSNAFLTP